MKVAVFGLGYVGAVSAACFADAGHAVTGVDTNPLKLDLIRDGRTPVLEPGLDELIAKNVAAGRLQVSSDAEVATTSCEISLICVGTPPQANGSTDLTALRQTVEAIGQALPASSSRHTVVIRSTSPPGTCRDTVIPILEASSGLVAGRDFGVAVNPEFLREGTSLHDFRHPPKTVIGQIDAESGDAVKSLYGETDGPIFLVPLEIAETVKYADNAFHALKISFANEIGTACREFGIDSHRVMEILCSDTKLNISTAYLRPGFAFGGSCLPKDLRSLLHATRRADLRLPLIESILPSNETHLRRLVDIVVGLGRRRVGIVGLAFKTGTDDLRESPLVELSEQLLGKGFDLKIYDPAVSLSQIVGSNREYIQRRIPHLSSLLVNTPEELFEHADICIVGSAQAARVSELTSGDRHIVVDLVRLPDADVLRARGGYIGIAW